MKRHHVIAVAVAVSIASACSPPRSLPSTNGAQALPVNAGASSAQIVAANDRTPEAVDGADAGTPCKHPQFPTICVRRGHSATLGIEITCTKSGKTVKCGTVTWSAKTSDNVLPGRSYQIPVTRPSKRSTPRRPSQPGNTRNRSAPNVRTCRTAQGLPRADLRARQITGTGRNGRAKARTARPLRSPRPGRRRRRHVLSIGVRGATSEPGMWRNWQTRWI